MSLTSTSSRPCSFLFRPFSGDKVFEALKGPKRSTGADHLDPYLLLLAAPVITDVWHLFLINFNNW